MRLTLVEGQLTLSHASKHQYLHRVGEKLTSPVGYLGLTSCYGHLHLTTWELESLLSAGA